MTSQVYYRKWRPGSFAELVGQEHVATTLRQSVKQGRVSHSYLFCGPRGSGKTTSARIIAKAVNCLDVQEGDPCNSCTICLAINAGRFMDIIELDAASNRGIDEIRDIREKVNFSPAQGSRKVYIIDEAHMLTDAASNAFLKTLEEPPGHVIFVLCTTEAHKILPTIVSRCQRFDFRRIPSELIYNRLATIAEAEGVTIDTEALRMVSRYAAGSMRDAQNLLEQLVVSHGDGVGLSQVEDLLGLGHSERWLDLVRYMLMGNTSASFGVINQAAWEGTDLRQLHRQTLELLRAVLLIHWGSGNSLDLPDHVASQLGELVGQLPPWRIVKAVKTWGEVNMRFDPPSTLPLELAVVEICQDQDVAPIPSIEPASEPASSHTAAVSPPPVPRAESVPSPVPTVTARTQETRPEPTVAPQPVPLAEYETEPTVAPQPVPIAEYETEPSVAPQPVPLAEYETEPTVAPQPVPLAEYETEPTVAPKPVPIAESDAEPTVAPQPVPLAEYETEPTVAPQPVPIAESDAEPVPTEAETASNQPAPSQHASVGVAGASDLAEAWVSTVKALARHKGKKYNLGALLRDCRSDAISLDGDTLILAFTHRTHLERMQEEMEDPKGRNLVTEVVGQFFQQPYGFRLTLLEGNGTTGSSPRSAQNSPLVRAAMGMGARIIEEVVE